MYATYFDLMKLKRFKNYLKQTNSYLQTMKTGLPLGKRPQTEIKLELIRLGNSTKLFNYVYGY